jgi:O6-methylguanine-DNA--protein-cysteine methyltransferase
MARRSATQLAHAVGRPDICAVAAAVGRTPVPIIIPCHRRGPERAHRLRRWALRKRALLVLEGAATSGRRQLTLI